MDWIKFNKLSELAVGEYLGYFNDGVWRIFLAGHDPHEIMFWDDDTEGYHSHSLSYPTHYVKLSKPDTTE